MRIVSLFPAATEMVASLGLHEALVGRSHECNWPAEIRSVPAVVKSEIRAQAPDSTAIDAEVRALTEAGKPLYTLDMEALAALNPTHVLVQDLCRVCALPEDEARAAVEALPSKPEIVSLSARTLTDIAQNMRSLGDALGCHAEAEVLLIEWKARMDEIQARVAARPRVRCFMMEWVEPIYCSGHWIAEMVQMAGGYDLLARPGQDSVPVAWEEVVAEAPEVLFIAPCGYDIDQASGELARLTHLPGWRDLPAVRNTRVYALNADAFITRPGPRVVDGIEMLAYLLHGG